MCSSRLPCPSLSLSSFICRRDCVVILWSVLRARVGWHVSRVLPMCPSVPQSWTWLGLAGCFRGGRVPPAACSSRRSRPPIKSRLLRLSFFLLYVYCYCLFQNHSKLKETYFKEYFEELMCTLCPGTPCTFPTRWDPRSSHVFRAVSPVQGHSLTSLQRGDSWAFPWHLQPRHIWYYRPVLSNASQFGFVWCFLTREWELCILAGKSQVSSQGTLLGGGMQGDLSRPVALALLSWLRCCLLGLPIMKSLPHLCIW